MHNNMIAKSKYLVVDDEFNQDDREDFILDIGEPSELALFASNYDEARQLISENLDIAICFLDYQIPKNAEDKYDIEKDTSQYWGLSLIPEIKALNADIQIIVYSAYVTKKYLQEKGQEFVGSVTDFLDKSATDLVRQKLYQKALEAKKTYYSKLDAPTALLVRQQTLELKELIQKTTQSMIAIGKHLIKIKSLLNHGQYLPWLESEIGISSVTACRFILLAQTYDEYSVEELNHISPTALAELAEGQIPKEKIREIIESAKSQGKLSVQEAKQIRDSYKKLKKTKYDTIDVTAETVSDPPKLEGLYTPLNEFGGLPLDKVSKSHSSSKVITGNKQDIVLTIPQQRKWHLNQKHLVFALDPNNPLFLQKLPSKVSLCLTFAPNQDWRFQFNQSDTLYSFSSIHDDLDYESDQFLDIVLNTVEFSTNGDENIVVCWIPNLKILTAIDQLGCRAYIAEPNREKCIALVNNYNLL